MTIVLDRAEYYRLRYLQAVAETATAQAEVVALRAAAQAGRASQAFVDALDIAGRAQSFDPTVPYRWDDATTSLVCDADVPPVKPTQE